MKKIDAHLHININGITTDNIIDYMDKNNITTGWLLTWEEETPSRAKHYNHLPIEPILELYNKFPDRIVPFYAPPPTYDGKALNDVFTKYKEKGIKGCGELKVNHLWEDEGINLYIKILQKYELPLVFHMEAPRFYIPPQDIIASRAESIYLKAVKNFLNFMPSKILQKYRVFFSRNFSKTFFNGYLYDFMGLEKMLVKYPEQTFIAHGPHFWNNISTNVSTKNRYSSGKIKKIGIIDRLLEEYDNLFCDISGGSGFNALSRDTDSSVRFLDKHHKKILFGTDNYIQAQHENILNSLNLSPEKKNNIFYRNAEKILH